MKTQMMQFRVKDERKILIEKCAKKGLVLMLQGSVFQIVSPFLILIPTLRNIPAALLTSAAHMQLNNF